MFITRETYSRKTTTTHQQQQGSQLQGSDSVLLQSGEDMRLAAAKVDAGNELIVDSGAGLDIVAGIDSQRTEEQVRHRKDLWRGDSDTDQLKETAKGSTLGAKHMAIKASGKLDVQGSSLHSRGDLAIQAKQADIGTTTLQERGTKRDYRGDLVSGTFFGDRQGKDTEGKAVAGSTVASEGKLTVALDITVTDDLRREGVARELINRIQNIRKDSGFEVTDRIRVEIEAKEAVVGAVAAYADYIGQQTLARDVRTAALPEGEFVVESEIDEEPLKIAVTKL